MEQLSRNEWLSAAGFLFERRRGIGLFDYAYELIAAAGLHDATVNDVAEQVVDLLDSEPLDARERTTAYWALGKLGDNRHLKFLQARLREELVNIRVAHQAMIALANLGERVFAPERTGISFDEDALNRRDAMEYLERLG